MQQLSHNWFLEGMQDFEYKKYVLLAYLQHVSQEFAQVRLYPSFSDLIAHYHNLDLFQKERQRIADELRRKRSTESPGLAPSDLPHPTGESDDLDEINAIVSYALPSIRTQLKEGKDIYDFIEDQLLIEPIGITPLYRKEGYLFLRVNKQPELKVFDYQVIFFENVDGNHYGISFTPLDTYRVSLTYTYEAIKLDLLRSHGKYLNPATYLLFTPQAFPEEASLIPIAKRKMLAYLKRAEE